jgi:hypothetical protein
MNAAVFFFTDDEHAHFSRAEVDRPDYFPFASQ